jgi:beta-lactamase regulating signal transducer with metallopeptidase domain
MWMVYAVAVGAITAGGALALDRVAEIWDVSRRGIWLAALLAATIVPLARAVAPAAPALRAGRDVAFDTGGVERRLYHIDRAADAPPSLPRSVGAVVARLSASYPTEWNRDALIAWVVSSLALLLAFTRGAWRLRRRRTEWHDADVDGHRVMISEDVGPAVVGALRPRVVLPSWVLSLQPVDRALMLRHEFEHVRARDPLLLLAGAAVVALQPWNPLTWFIARRLRLAMEIDCDRRVLRRERRTREYGLLLLAVGARPGSPLQFTPSLAEPRLFLERRIIAMTARRPERPLLASLPFFATAIIAAVAGAQTPPPAPPAAAGASRAATATSPVDRDASTAATTASTAIAATAPTAATVATTARMTSVEAATAPPSIAVPAPRSIPIEVLREWVRQHHPTVMTGDPSINYITIVVNAQDEYVTSRADSFDLAVAGTDPALPPALRVRAMVGDSLLLLPRIRVRNANEPQPIYIVDGQRVDDPNGINPATIKRVEVLKGQYAATQYGAGAENGVIVIDTQGEDGRLRQLGVETNQIQSIEILRVAAETIGPNALRLMVVKLKPAGA